MTYSEAINFLFNSLPVWERAGAGAYKPGLERISAFARTLGDPQERIKTVHVAGTNGKGSVCHMLAAVLQAAGYRTGLFTSPHLIDFRERVRVNGEMIPGEAVVEFTERWHGEMVRDGLSFFEMTTAMAFWWFERSGCGIAVIETGLGGRLDSTNIITPVVSVITNIGLEHTMYLGDTVAAIAAEKAGIIKAGVPVVIGESDPESEPVFRARAAELDAPVVFADRVCFPLSSGEGGCRSPQSRSRRTERGGNIRAGQCNFVHAAAASDGVVKGDATTESHKGDDFSTDLAGDYQQKNLRTVLAAVEVLRRTLVIPDGALRAGLAHAAATTGLAGRWQVVSREPLVVLDTAHNAHGIAEVSRQIARQRFEKLYMVMGFAADKDLRAILPLLPRGAHYILTRAATPRALPAAELAEKFAGFWKERPSVSGCGDGDIPSAEITESVPDALNRAFSLADPGDMIFIGGSNFVVGDAAASGLISVLLKNE